MRYATRQRAAGYGNPDASGLAGPAVLAMICCPGGELSPVGDEGHLRIGIGITASLSRRRRYDTPAAARVSAIAGWILRPYGTDI